MENTWICSEFIFEMYRVQTNYYFCIFTRELDTDFLEYRVHANKQKHEDKNTNNLVFSKKKIFSV